MAFKGDRLLSSPASSFSAVNRKFFHTWPLMHANEQRVVERCQGVKIAVKADSVWGLV